MSGRDVELTERIERLEKQVAQLTEVLDEIVAKNIPVNSLLFHADASGESTRPFVARFDEKFGIPNSYEAESWKGKTFRWLGPSPSTTLSIPRDRSVGYDLKIVVPHFTGGSAVLAGTTISADGLPVVSRVTDEGDDKVITAVIPPQPAQVQFPAFLLTIEYPKAWKLREPSARVVTLAVSQISLMPRR